MGGIGIGRGEHSETVLTAYMEHVRRCPGTLGLWGGTGAETGKEEGCFRWVRGQRRPGFVGDDEVEKEGEAAWQWAETCKRDMVETRVACKLAKLQGHFATSRSQTGSPETVHRSMAWLGTACMLEDVDEGAGAGGDCGLGWAWDAAGG